MAHQRWLCFDHLTLQIWDTATKQMWLRVPKVLSDTFKVTWMPPPCPLPQPIAKATISIEVGTLVAVTLL